MKDYLQGAYDLHIHCGPDVLPRKVTALEMAKRAVDCGMKLQSNPIMHRPVCRQMPFVIFIRIAMRSERWY